MPDRAAHVVPAGTVAPAGTTGGAARPTVAGPQTAAVGEAAGAAVPRVCPRFHLAVELVGRRWTGAILATLLAGGPLRFSELAAALPALSDRVLSTRMRELEAHGLVARTVAPGPPLRVTYRLTEMGRSLDAAIGCLQDWAQDWLPVDDRAGPAEPDRA